MGIGFSLYGCGLCGSGRGERHSSMRTNGPAAEVLAKSAAFQIIVLVSAMSIAGAEMMRR